MIAPPKRVLILKACCIGDVLMATPLAAALKAAWPDSEIDWAVAAHARPVLAGNPHISRLVDASGTFRGDLRLRDVVRLVRRIRRGRYDAAFVPDRSPVSAWIVRLAGVPLRVGLDGGGGRGWPHGVRVPTPPDDPRPEREIYLSLARAVGVDLDPTRGRPVFVPSAEDRAAASAAVAMVGAGVGAGTGDAATAKVATGLSATSGEDGGGAAVRRPVVVLHPGGGENPGMTLHAKRWPPERFGALARRVVERGGRIVLVGGPGDRALGAAIRERAAIEAAVATAEPAEREEREERVEIAGVAGVEESAAVEGRATIRREAVVAGERGGVVVDLIGRLSLGATAAMIERADAFVGNDSGIAHLAAAVGTPVVVIFGPTDPIRYGPAPGTGVAVWAGAEAAWTERTADVVGHGGRDASTGVPLRALVGSRAIDAVTIERVVEALDALLAEEGGGKGERGVDRAGDESEPGARRKSGSLGTTLGP